MISMFLYKKKNSRQSSAANQLFKIAMSICDIILFPMIVYITFYVIFNVFRDMSNKKTHKRGKRLVDDMTNS